MKLLLDECMPRRIRRDLTGHAVFTVEQAGLKGFKNGELLRAASGAFDVLITVDQSIIHQQKIQSFNLAVLVLAAKSNAYHALKPLVPQVLEALKQIKEGEVVRVKLAR